MSRILRLIKPATETDMISVYLISEIDGRFGLKIIELLEQDHQSRSVVDFPDITNCEENLIRRKLLAGYRAYVFGELWHISTGIVPC